MTNTYNNDFPLLQSYKKKSECRIFLEDFLNIAIPFIVVIGGILLTILLISNLW